MNYQTVELGPSHELLLPYDESGYYCPICAMPHGDRGMYYTNGVPAYDCICPDCGLHPGYDDVPKKSSGLTQEQYIRQFRRKWLDSVDWAPKYVERLKRVFQLSDSGIDSIRNP